MALATAFLTPWAFAAQPPDAGQLLESIKPVPELRPDAAPALPEALPARPTMALPADVKVFVRHFRISGARAFSGQDLLALLQDAEGREWRLADLQGLADRITRHYRDHGYLLAWAYIPAQSIEDGTVEIAVLEGRLGRLALENHSLLGDSAAARQLGGLRPGEAIQGPRLERALLLLNDLPGVEVRSTLKPGASVGLTDLDVALAAGRPVDGNVTIDTFGDRFTGSLRAGATLNLNSPAGWGDVLSLRGLTAGEGLSYGRVAYQVPVGAVGTRAGIAWSQMRYELGKDFSALQAHGDAEIATVYLLQPLLRSRRTNLNAQLTYEHKELDDRVDALATASRKKLDVWSLGLSGDQADGLGGGGISQYGASLVAGDLGLDPASAALDGAGLRTRGDYTKVAYQAMRLQRFTDSLHLKGQLSGQSAQKNLDSSEKLSLGGAYGVRAYPQGEAASDDAWLLNLELRYAPAPAWQLIGFYDAASGRISHERLPGTSRNSRWLSGAGVGMTWSQAADLSFQAFAAWRTAAGPQSDNDRSPRFWLQGVKHF
ncbi:MAG: polypeptide-transport-associated domain protein, ShlB-type [Rhodocyclaceae bacterium]|nr:polypeptide-transport-associated domain protein, ShlB-type [Rhodocyclaceae bacterium]